MKNTFNLKKLSAAVIFAMSAVGSANAGPLFWAVNQFQTIQELDGDTGAVVTNIPVPFGSGSAASIAVIGNTGFYTLLSNPEIQKIDNYFSCTMIKFLIASNSFGEVTFLAVKSPIVL